MRLAVSHSYFNKKLDEFGLGHDEAINRIMEIEKKELERTHPTHSIPACEETINMEVGDSNMSEASKAIFMQNALRLFKMHHNQTWKLIFRFLS